MAADDSCPIFEHLRGTQGVCTPQPVHFDLIATVQMLAAQRDRAAAVERAHGQFLDRRNRAIVAAATRSVFRDGRLVGSLAASPVASEPVRVLRQSVTR